MTRRTIDRLGWLLFVMVVCGAQHTAAAPIDERGEMRLSTRAYTAVRVGTQDTDLVLIGTPDRITSKSYTFPVSAAGHMRQHRFFVEATLEHDLDRLLREGFGPFALLNELPFDITRFGYFLSYRGEYDGIYDYGPSEFRTAYQFRNKTLAPDSPFGFPVDVLGQRRRLRDVASLRNRLFQAYVQFDVGPLFVRFGRQILAWGETDIFRLLDNINPLDNSFGGFLVPLDERRVPIDMLRASYAFGEIPGTPFYETFIEAFGAIDNAVGFDPGIPNGSPWQLPNFVPSATLLTVRNAPAANFSDMRGGAQLKWMSSVPWFDTATFSLAHYYTYLDLPAVQFFVPANFPLPFTSGRGETFNAIAQQTAPLVQITGATASFAVPPEWARLLYFSSEPIIRTELAYFHNEPRWSQQQLDPFVFALARDGEVCPGGTLVNNDTVCTPGRRTGDSWNLMIGMDTQQAIRWLNPDASFFITTQFFYKHLRGGYPRTRIQTPMSPLPGQPVLFNGEVLPVQRSVLSTDRWGVPLAAAEPEYVHNPVDQYLQTLLIATTYAGGKWTPNLGVLFDWSGALVVQPAVTYLYDPFRFTFSYSYLWGSDLRGGAGISLLRDRDNVLFQLEYSL